MATSKQILFLILLFFAGTGFAQNNNLDDVHLFQTFFNDATVARDAYGEGIFGFSDYDFVQIINLGVRGGIPINSQFEMGGGLAFLNADPDGGNGESGISDIHIAGKYHFQTDGPAQFSAGAAITLPVGSEDVGQSETNLSLFGALRYPVAQRTVITGVAALEFLEGIPVRPGGWPALFVGDETSLLLGGGVIHQASRDVYIVGELNFATEGDFGLLSGGVDYQLQSGRLRGLLGIGVDDGAPDIALVVSYLIVIR